MARQFVSDQNLTPVVQILCWFFLICTFLAVGVRAATKQYMTRKVTPDDWIIAAALVFVIAQSVAVTIQTQNGLGKPASAVSAGTLVTDLKASYASNYFYVLSISLSKLAVVTFVVFLSPVRWHRRVATTLGAFIGAWTVASFFVVAFQCSVAAPYDFLSEKCIDSNAFWISYETLNIITDIALVALPSHIAMSIRAKTSRKISLVFVFGLRLLVVAASICKIAYIAMLNLQSDLIIELWRVVILTQLIQCLSLITTCSLYLQPFLEGSSPGFLFVDDMRRRGEKSSDGYGTSLSKGGSQVHSAIRSLPGRQDSSSNATSSDGQGGGPQPMAINVSTTLSVDSEPRQEQDMTINPAVPHAFHGHAHNGSRQQ